MDITSPVFGNNGQIPVKYTCRGESVRPPLEIKDVPGNAKSLVIIMDDPDAPVGLFTHWIMWDTPPTTTIIEENSIPKGAVEGKNSAGRTGYISPCPPSGTGIHRYQFRIFALSKEINLPRGSNRQELESAMEGSILEKTELIGKFPPNP